MNVKICKLMMPPIKEFSSIISSNMFEALLALSKTQLTALDSDLEA